ILNGSTTLYIAILDIQEDLGQEAISTLKSLYNVEAQFYFVDVRDEVSVQQVIDSVVRDLGSVDIVVNSAGVADLVHSEEYPPDRFRRVVDINLHGSFLVSQACGRQMIKQKRGGLGFGYMDTALSRAYSTLFNEWCSRIPQGRLGAPDELCGACIWLASKARSFCTGSDIIIDGGYTV
ncbi:hypothetical protein K7432_015505, partial [Basidiobolus ranarum]